MVLDKSQRTEEKCNNEKFIDFVQYKKVQLLFANKSCEMRSRAFFLITVKNKSLEIICC